MKRIILLIFILSLLNCSKDNSIVNFLEYLDPYQGITKTLGTGTVVTEDTTDWHYKHVAYPRLSNALFPVYPNPISIGDTLNIKYQLENRSQVKLEIINNKFRSIKVLIDQEIVGGHYWLKWDLKNNDGFYIEPNMYRCVLKINEFTLFGDVLIQPQQN